MATIYGSSQTDPRYVNFQQSYNPYPIGPSKPGYVQGTANRVPISKGSVLGALTGPGATAPTQPSGSVFSDASSAAQSENDALLSQINSEYDYNRSNLLSQIESLGRQQSDAEAQLETQRTGITTDVNRQKKQSQDITEENINTARSTAQDVQRKNRNTLRALGILNSTAAGELLSKPFNEFDKQRAQFVQSNVNRLQQLDDFLNQKNSELADAARAIKTQYTDLVGRIQNDLRFNDRQRVDAVKSANAALQQRLSEIKTAQFNYQAQVDALKGKITTGINEISNYTAPSVNTGALLSTGINVSEQQAPSTVGIAQDEEQKRLLSSLYGTSGGGGSF